jgi:hypothetical protein
VLRVVGMGASCVEVVSWLAAVGEVLASVVEMSSVWGVVVEVDVGTSIDIRTSTDVEVDEVEEVEGIAANKSAKLSLEHNVSYQAKSALSR